MTEQAYQCLHIAEATAQPYSGYRWLFFVRSGKRKLKPGYGRLAAAYPYLDFFPLGATPPEPYVQAVLSRAPLADRALSLAYRNRPHVRVTPAQYRP